MIQLFEFQPRDVWAMKNGLEVRFNEGKQFREGTSWSCFSMESCL